MKAYHVHDRENSGEEACHEIVFAESPAQAKYQSEAYSNCVPWTDISVRRTPQFDQYAEKGTIPKSAYVADGWYFEYDVCFGGKIEDFKNLQKSREQAIKYFDRQGLS
jgi:hypothetical protein